MPGDYTAMIVEDPLSIRLRALDGLSTEMVERLERARPVTFGHARRVKGLTSAALSVLLVGLNLRTRAA